MGYFQHPSGSERPKLVGVHRENVQEVSKQKYFPESCQDLETAYPIDYQRSAGGRTRTDKSFRITDFKSVAFTISPRRRYFPRECVCLNSCCRVVPVNFTV